MRRNELAPEKRSHCLISIISFEDDLMMERVRARYTLKFKQEAVRLVRGGQSASSVARSLGVSSQSVDSWSRAEASGRLRESTAKPINADQMEIARLRAELSKARMERDILKKAMAYFALGAR